MDIDLVRYRDILSPEAQELLNKMLPKYYEKQEEVKRIPVSVLIWGPSIEISTKLSDARERLRELLREDGHLAMFSEELCSEESGLSTVTQECLQAEQFNVIISIPSTPGSIAESHNFSSIQKVCNKLVMFLNSEYRSGYSNSTLETLSVRGAKIFYYENEDDSETIINISIDYISKIRECKYLYG